MTAVIHCGDVRDVLATLPAGSVQCCVTSPPYYALRDYGVAGQIGLEPTIAEYLAAMVAVFRDVRRVLRDDGTLWLNIGDSYVAPRGNTANAPGFDNKAAGGNGATLNFTGTRPSGTLKTKDLCLIPARLALALQEDGWWVRSEIIWAKPNPMPESVQDRPTVAHEHIWLLTKAARYFYDSDAIAERAAESTQGRAYLGARPLTPGQVAIQANGIHGKTTSLSVYDRPTRNARTVWDIATSGFSEAHFATFPLEIPRRCILAGTSERGACPACGVPWRRVVERDVATPGQRPGYMRDTGVRNDGDRAGHFIDGATRTLDWQPTCRCDAGEPVPCVVLDPFSGSGTTGVVALRHGRDYIGIELNSEYAAMSERRIRGDAPLLNRVRIEAA